MAAVSSLWLVVILSAVCSARIVDSCAIRVRNNCSYPITACSQSGALDIVQHDLAVNSSIILDLGGGCSWPAGSVYASVTGRCAVIGSPNAATDRELANLAEFSIDSKGGLDFYDLSNVNAYTVGLAIKPSKKSCRALHCSIQNISTFCQAPNRIVRHATGAETCMNTDGPNVGPTHGTRLFKKACPRAYSYSLDDATSTYVCTSGGNYDVIFCP